MQRNRNTCFVFSAAITSDNSNKVGLKVAMNKASKTNRAEIVIWKPPNSLLPELHCNQGLSSDSDREMFYRKKAINLQSIK